MTVMVIHNLLQKGFIMLYDDKRELIECDDSNSVISSYKYDNRKNKIEDCEFVDGRLLTKWTSKYDDGNNIIETNHLQQDSTNIKHTYKYDENNNEIENIESIGTIKSIYKNPKPLVNKTTSVYANIDSEGNWLKKTIYYNSSPGFIIIQTIEYYK